MPRLSTAARVTLVAGLLSALLAGGGGVWIRHEVYPSRYEVERERARTSLELIVDNLGILALRRQDAPTVSFPRTQAMYEIVDSAGRTAEVSSALAPFQANGRPIQPTPHPN